VQLGVSNVGNFLRALLHGEKCLQYRLRMLPRSLANRADTKEKLGVSPGSHEIMRRPERGFTGR